MTARKPPAAELGVAPEEYGPKFAKAVDANEETELRDAFAAVSVLVVAVIHGSSPTDVARLAYDLADAMILERRRRRAS